MALLPQECLWVSPGNVIDVQMLDQAGMKAGVGVGKELVLYLAAAERDSCSLPARGPRDALCCHLPLALSAAAGDRSTCVHFSASGSGRATVTDTSSAASSALLLLFSAAASCSSCRQPSAATGSRESCTLAGLAPLFKILCGDQRGYESLTAFCWNRQQLSWWLFWDVGWEEASGFSSLAPPHPLQGNSLCWHLAARQRAGAVTRTSTLAHCCPLSYCTLPCAVSLVQVA